MRIALGIEYDGFDFHGWQSQQASVRTVQDCLQTALSKVAAESIKLHCAGRTDTGVHASNQVVHFDSDKLRPLRAWVLGSNTHLPADISIRWAQPIAEDFHARFSALARRYRYQILNRPTRSALQYRQMALCRTPLDVHPMQQAAAYLLGEHDFSAFRAAACQSHSPMRNVYALSLRRNGDVITIDIEANAFLHHMVRNIVGTLMVVGRGEQQPAWVHDVLTTRDRREAGMTAAPQGLCLTAVRYPTRFNLPCGTE